MSGGVNSFYFRSITILHMIVSVSLSLGLTNITTTRPGTPVAWDAASKRIAVNTCRDDGGHLEDSDAPYHADSLESNTHVRVARSVSRQMETITGTKHSSVSPVRSGIPSQVNRIKALLESDQTGSLPFRVRSRAPSGVCLDNGESGTPTPPCKSGEFFLPTQVTVELCSAANTAFVRTIAS